MKVGYDDQDVKVVCEVMRNRPGRLMLGADGLYLFNPPSNPAQHLARRRARRAARLGMWRRWARAAVKICKAQRNRE